jgi:hypothetical protein
MIKKSLQVKSNSVFTTFIVWVKVKSDASLGIPCAARNMAAFYDPRDTFVKTCLRWRQAGKLEHKDLYLR